MKPEEILKFVKENGVEIVDLNFDVQQNMGASKPTDPTPVLWYNNTQLF